MYLPLKLNIIIRNFQMKAGWTFYDPSAQKCLFWQVSENH